MSVTGSSIHSAAGVGLPEHFCSQRGFAVAYASAVSAHAIAGYPNHSHAPWKTAGSASSVQANAPAP